MAFKRPGGFGAKKSFSRGSFGKGDFSRGPRDRERSQLFVATCADCGQKCEVPFRPTGERPVFCKECFGGSRGNQPEYGRPARPERALRPFNRERESAPFGRAHAPAPRSDARLDGLAHKVDDLAHKLDQILELLAASAPAAPAKRASLATAVKKAAKKAAQPPKA